MTATVIVETGTADCPTFSALLGGKTDTEVEALSATITAWTDGAEVTITTGFGTLWQAAIIAQTGAFGVASGIGATGTTAVNGAYTQFVSVAASTALNADATVDYLLPANVVTDALMDGTTTPVVCTGAKYAVVSAPASVVDTVALVTSAGTYASTFYLPKEPTTEAEGPTTTTGDRWDNGDLLVAYNVNILAAGNTQTLCSIAAGVELVLGATSLAAAGAASIAAALSI
jgi:hypothetical protein